MSQQQRDMLELIRLLTCIGVSLEAIASTLAGIEMNQRTNNG